MGSIENLTKSLFCGAVSYLHNLTEDPFWTYYRNLPSVSLHGGKPHPFLTIWYR